MSRIGAIIITYHPDMIRLKKNLDSLTDQVNEIIIVDTGSEDRTILLVKLKNIRML